MIKIEEYMIEAENPKMKDDKIYEQEFTCCNTTLEAYFWEGWDKMEDDTIDEDILEKFKYCPFCGKKIDKIVRKENSNEI